MIVLFDGLSSNLLGKLIIVIIFRFSHDGQDMQTGPLVSIKNCKSTIKVQMAGFVLRIPSVAFGSIDSALRWLQLIYCSGKHLDQALISAAGKPFRHLFWLRIRSSTNCDALLFGHFFERLRGLTVFLRHNFIFELQIFVRHLRRGDAAFIGCSVKS